MSVVTLSLAKSYLNLSRPDIPSVDEDGNPIMIPDTSGDADNELLQLLIDAAESWLSNYIGKPIAEFVPCPADLKRAVLMLTAFYYEQREAVSYGITGQLAPYGVSEIAESYRVSRFGVTVDEEA